MGYQEATIECDGEHSHQWNDKGEIQSGEEIFCQTCMDKLNEKISELEEKLQNSENEVEDRNATIRGLEEQIEALEKHIEELQHVVN
jgi:peptidoglycan hydrolase CwlO-like protein